MHPVHVARLLERHGFSEDVVIAGLLHDVLEDVKFDDKGLQDNLVATFPGDFGSIEKTGSGFRAAVEIFVATHFGRKVLDLVKDVTELKTKGGIKRPWRVRRQEQSHT
jgi:(p)ppGpp synthase/HD superfamily hydrolase